jgi:alkaline phosphatase
LGYIGYIGNMSLRAKNVIFMVSDGMSLGVPSLAEPFSKLVRQRPTAWYQLAQSREVSHGLFETASLNSLVTDSAAASSAWNSGSRVFNHYINVLPDGTQLVPLGPLAQQAGRKVGIVTTATVTHATPAALLVAQADRNSEQEIARQFLHLAPQFLARTPAGPPTVAGRVCQGGLPMRFHAGRGHARFPSREDSRPL